MEKKNYKIGTITMRAASSLFKESADFLICCTKGVLFGIMSFKCIIPCGVKMFQTKVISLLMFEVLENHFHTRIFF